MTQKTCPNCHSPIPDQTPGGLCPACVFRDAEETAMADRSAPSVQEIAAAFPQLEVLELIGLGGMGAVYKVRQPSLDRIVALKILSPELSKDPAFAERFAREARVLGKLNHPNIVSVFEHGESGGYFYLIMEFVDGMNLREAMRAGRFSPLQALSFVPGICDALQAAHEQGVWHRDIKPENILLDSNGSVKIADFGIARMIGDPQRDFTLTMTGNALGSAAYMSPEQHESPHDVDHRADIYSLGVVIYEMLTGELPLGRFPAPSERSAVNTRIDGIVFRTLEKERELRQQSATELKQQVENVDKKMDPVKNDKTSRPGKWALGLFVASMLIGIFLTNSGVAGSLEVLLISGLGLLISFVLGILSWSTMRGRFAAIASGLVLAAAAVFLMFPEKPASTAKIPTHQIPEGYEGFVILVYGQEGYPSVAESGTHQIFKYPEDGILITMALPRFGKGAKQVIETYKPSSGATIRRRDYAQKEWFGTMRQNDLEFNYLVKAVGNSEYWQTNNINDYQAKIDEARQKLFPMPKLKPKPKPIRNYRIIAPRNNWKITEGDSVIELNGKLETSTENGALTVHVGGHPVLMIASNKSYSSSQNWTLSRSSKGHIAFGGSKIDYHVSDGDKATIANRVCDLKLGRTFFIRSDGKLQQIKARPERVLSKKDLKKFIADLPPE